MCVLWSYRRLHCWTNSLIEFDAFSQETQEFEGSLEKIESSVWELQNSKVNDLQTLNSTMFW